MITRIASAVALCGAVAFVAGKPTPNPPIVADQLLDSLVAANARPLSLDRGRLQGAGAEWLLSQAAHAQFLAIGEEHNVVEIPELVTALLTDLEPRAGYRYVALDDRRPPSAPRELSANRRRATVRSARSVRASRLRIRRGAVRWRHAAGNVRTQSGVAY